MPAPLQIRFRAFITDGFGEHDGGTSIMVTVPDGLEEWQQIEYITGRVASEVSRYLAKECLTALRS